MAAVSQLLLKQEADRVPRWALLRVFAFVLVVSFPSNGQVSFGQSAGSVTPPSQALIDQLTLVAQAAVNAGFPVSLTPGPGGSMLLSGMPVWELGKFSQGSNYEAVVSHSAPTNVAINIDSISFGGVGSVDEYDIAELVSIAVHESAHKDFAENLLVVCAFNPAFWAGVIACHKEESGSACNEAYAHSKATRELCSMLGGNMSPEQREALEGETYEQISNCTGFEAACAAANAECGPPAMPMPSDHEPCGGCEACTACQ